MNVSNTMDILKFYEVLNIRYGYEQARIFKGIFTDYTNLMLEYNIKMVGEEIDEISATQEDNKNIVNLLEFNNKKGMNLDIFRILYENIVSTEGQKKYSNFVDC
jgi:hypothetical protein